MSHKFSKRILTAFTSIAVLLLASPLFLQQKLFRQGDSYSKAIFAMGAMIAAGFAIGVGAVGAGLGIGTAANGACQRSRKKSRRTGKNHDDHAGRYGHG